MAMQPEPWMGSFIRDVYMLHARGEFPLEGVFTDDARATSGRPRCKTARSDVETIDLRPA